MSSTKYWSGTCSIILVSNSFIWKCCDFSSSLSELCLFIINKNTICVSNSPVTSIPSLKSLVVMSYGEVNIGQLLGRNALNERIAQNIILNYGHEDVSFLRMSPWWSYVHCIIRMPGGVIVGNSGLCCVSLCLLILYKLICMVKTNKLSRRVLGI